MNPAERYQQITEIFISVCQLGEPERTRALEDLCAGCPDLRSELDLLLAFHDRLSKSPAAGESLN